MNILILGGKFGTQSANTVCIMNLAKEMVSQGDKVSIIMLGNKDIMEADFEDGIQLFVLKDKGIINSIKKILECKSLFFNLFGRLLMLFRYLVMMPFYPNVTPLGSCRLANFAKKVVTREATDLVIGTYGGYENVYAALMIKKKCKLPVVLYYFDLCTTSANKNRIIRGYSELSTYKSIAKNSNKVDRILIPFSGRRIIESQCKANSNVIKYVGFPVYFSNPTSQSCNLPFNKDRLDLVYIGSLSKQNRDPSYFISILEAVALRNDVNIMMHFWGGIADDELLQRIEKSPIAEYHGILDNKFTSFVIQNCSFVVNIGNALSFDMLPSKLFSLFSSGKPIINVVNNKNDASLQYLEQYKNVIYVKGYLRNLERDVLLLEGGLKELNNRKVNVDSIFREFTPHYISGIIKDIFVDVY